jgi:NAD(P)-dependent dehydrogenase (short-subunit alcohol dehydrogenase family)
VSQRLDGKVAVVTGAGTGIGAASSLALAAEGAKVALFGPREKELEKVGSRITAGGGEALAVVGDVSLEADVENLVRSTDEVFGGMDILFNNAGVMLNKTVVEASEEEWDRVLAVNLKGVFLGCKHCIPVMQDRGGGSIINCGSPHALATQPRIAPYAAAKGGVLALTRQVAMDFARDGVRVNCVVPGTVDTPMLWNSQQLSDDPEADRREWAEKHPLGRLGTPEDVARAVVWLASSESSFTTGSTLYVDGGLLAQL